MHPNIKVSTQLFDYRAISAIRKVAFFSFSVVITTVKQYRFTIPSPEFKTGEEQDSATQGN
jgi:hypothetical protein